MLRLKAFACAVLARELYTLAAESANIIDVSLLPQGLHSNPDKLRQRLQAAIDGLGGDDIQYDAVLLGYCLCSNGLAGVKARGIPLVVPRGHDCITLLLGSKEAYRDYFDSHGGVYWYSSGWIERSLQPGRERYEKTLSEYRQRYGEDNALYLMEMENNWYREYSLATYVDWGFPGTEEYRRYTKECARYLGWGYDEVKGSDRLLRNLLEGPWGEMDFLVVPPGREIAARVNEPGIIDLL